MTRDAARSSRSPTWWAAVLGVTGLWCASCGGNPEPGPDSAAVLDVGTAVGLAPGPGTQGAPGVVTEPVVLPDGGIEVSWTADPGTLSEVTGLDGARLAAASDGGLLLVEWAPVASAETLTSSRGQTAAQGEAEDELALVSAGERTVLDVDRLDRSRGRVAAAVADPADVTLEVTFDAVTQSFGLGAGEDSIPAAAQVLYEGQPVSDHTSCALERSSASSPSCRAEVLWLPWVVDQGWAPDGELWPVVSLEAAGPDRSRPPSAIELSGVTLDGQQPLADVSGAQTPGELDGTLVCPATAARTVTVTAQLTATYADSGPATTSGEVTLTQG